LSRTNVQIQYDELLPFNPIQVCPLPLNLAPIVHFTIGATRLLECTVQSSPTVATVQQRRSTLISAGSDPLREALWALALRRPRFKVLLTPGPIIKQRPTMSYTHITAPDIIPSLFFS
jgi:hypothetical protein